MIPYAPNRLYQPDSSIIQLIQQAGRDAAQGQRAGGAIWGNAVRDVGQIAAGTIQDIAAGKAHAAEVARKEAQQAPIMAQQQRMGELSIQKAERERSDAEQEAMKAEKLGALFSGEAPPTPNAIIGLMGPQRGLEIVKGMAAIQPDSEKQIARYRDQQTLFRDAIGGLAATPGPLKPQAWTLARSALISKGLITEDMVPAEWSPEAEAVAVNFGRAPEKHEGFTLNPGDVRFDASGKKLASVAPRPDPNASIFIPGATNANPQGFTGEEYLKTLDPKIASEVKAYAEGRRPFPQGFALKSPYFQQLIQAVGQYDPSYDFSVPGGRAKTRADFTAGNSAKQITALNTVVGHLGDLSEKVSALNNSDVQAFNSAKNWFKTQTGSPDVTNFNTVKKGVQDELTRVWRQSGGSEQDIKTWGESLNSAGSNAQLHGVLRTIGGMLEARLSALANQKDQGLGKFGGDIRVLTPQSRKTLDLLEGRAGGETKSPKGQIILNPDGTYSRK